jgi:hypothetical protein
MGDQLHHTIDTIIFADHRVMPAFPSFVIRSLFTVPSGNSAKYACHSYLKSYLRKYYNLPFWKFPAEWYGIPLSHGHVPLAAQTTERRM